MSDEGDLERVEKILAQHKDKDFVRRILEWDGGEEQPYLDMGEGMKGTHMMATAEADGVHYAYPTIVRIQGELVQMNPQEAFRHAIDSGEAIPFDSEERAGWFAKNYKAVWGAK